MCWSGSQDVEAGGGRRRVRSQTAAERNRLVGKVLESLPRPRCFVTASLAAQAAHNIFTKGFDAGAKKGQAACPAKHPLQVGVCYGTRGARERRQVGEELLRRVFWHRHDGESLGRADQPSLELIGLVCACW